MNRIRYALTTAAILTTGHLSQGWNKNWDYKHDPENSQRSKHHIFYIRHGQYVSDHPDLKRYSGEEEFYHNDPLRPLTKLGREQAEYTADCISKILIHEGLLGGDGSAVRVICSDMTRAQETATVIHGKIQKASDQLNGAATKPILFKKDSILREGAPCTPEGSDWKPSDATFYQDGCRIEAAFRKYFHRQDSDRPTILIGNVKHSVDIIVGHGNVIRYSFLRALQLDPALWLRLGPCNASITRMAISDSGSVSVRGFGESGHIPVDKQTFN
ncbi:Serine/threonine-protein phosphatase pgam5, mitochondrial [Boothiomyces sp. JEL0866]|nr:Serine/threonine-protein phosphatase pgam5, mitochondrial [Boothiomyces sp. JEL0866]